MKEEQFYSKFLKDSLMMIINNNPYYKGPFTGGGGDKAIQTNQKLP